MRPLLLLLLLAACSNDRPAPVAAAATVPVIQPEPQVTVHTVRGSELLVLQVTERDEFGIGEKQRCYVWRDLEFKTTTLTCPASPAYPELVP